MDKQWTPAQVAAMAVFGLLALLGAWLFVGSAIAVIREFVVQTPPVPIGDNAKTVLIGVIGAIVSIVSITFGASVSMKRNKETKSHDSKNN